MNLVNAQALRRFGKRSITAGLRRGDWGLKFEQFVFELEG